ncbi:embigin [Cololabis saira]|uniref:embigin n=1 Tax=Cololabis saira TaxID=129043 RepID=UPI002AD31757|nr:embigin [Cololabis saira]
MTSSSKQLLLLLLLMLFCSSNTKTVEPSPTPPPLVPVSPLPTLTTTVTLTGQSHVKRIELINRANLSLECIWPGGQNHSLNITGYWAKDGREVQGSRVTVLPENEQYKLKAGFSIIAEVNLGNYSCVFGSEAKVDFILAAPQMAETRDKPVVSYVGDSVVLVCKMEEAKPMPNTWHWYKDNGTEKEQIFSAPAPHRYEIYNDERKTKLKVKNLTEADSGRFYCGAVYNISTSMSHMSLKVITFMEPLKPFISIMAEVIVLVAAILLWERSRSKKNNTEDATNADQNTLQQEDDNGTEESPSMRQRKVESP